MPAEPEFPFYADVHSTKLTGPGIDILEDMPVDALEMVYIEGTCNGFKTQLRYPVGGRNSLKLLKPVMIFNSREILKDGGSRIDVRISGHCGRCRELAFSFQRGIPHEIAHLR